MENGAAGLVSWIFLFRLERPFGLCAYFVGLLNAWAPRLLMVLMFLAVQQLATLYPLLRLIVTEIKLLSRVVYGT